MRRLMALFLVLLTAGALAIAIWAGVDRPGALATWDRLVYAARGEATAPSPSPTPLPSPAPTPTPTPAPAATPTPAPAPGPAAPTGLSKLSHDNSPLPAFRWDAAANATAYEVQVDSGAWYNIGGKLTYVQPTVLAKGSHTIAVRTRDAAGNTGAAASLSFIVSVMADLTNTKIAFTSNRDGNPAIYVMNPDGTGQTRLTSSAASATYPAWSPDGSRIAFECGSYGHSEICVMNADGSNVTQLTNNTANDARPAWSPDGSRIAFNSNRDHPGNYYGNIYIMNADGTDQTRVPMDAAYDAEPSWSPDGTRIVFNRGCSDSGGCSDAMYVMNADGSGRTAITGVGGPRTSPRWSPDGSRVVFSETPSWSHEGHEIYVMGIDGSGLTAVTGNAAADTYPSWSPDGSKVVFGSYKDSSYEIYTMNPDGSSPTRLTSGAAADWGPAWSPFLAVQAETPAPAATPAPLPSPAPTATPAATPTPAPTPTAVAAALLSLLPDGNTVNALGPQDVAVNRATNTIYVANSESGTITVIDGATNRATNVAVEEPLFYPRRVAVNEATNKLYFLASDRLDTQGRSLWEMDGVTSTVTHITYVATASDIAVNQATNTIYVAAAGSSSVMVVDAATRAITNIPLGAEPLAVAVNEATNRAYVGMPGSLAVIDGTDSTVTMALGPADTGGYRVAGLAVNQATNRVYAVGGYGGPTWAIDGADNTATRLPVPWGYDVAVSEATNRVYIVAADQAYAIDGATGSVVATIPLDVAYYYTRVTVNPALNEVYLYAAADSECVEGRGSAAVYVVSGEDHTGASVQVGGGQTALAVNDATGRVYAANRASHSISVLDRPASAVTEVVPGSRPMGVAVNRATGAAYVADWAGYRVWAIDAATGRVLGAVPVDKKPVTIAVNETTNTVYVGTVCLPARRDSDGDLVIMDGASYAATSVAIPRGGPWLVAVNQTTGAVYAANKEDPTVWIMDGATHALSQVFLPREPLDLAVNETTNEVWVASHGYVSVIDGSTNQVTPISLGTSYGPVAVAVSQAANKAYAGDGTTSRVWIVDGSDRSVVVRGGGDDVHDFQVDEATNRVYVLAANYLTLIDGATDAVVWTVGCGNCANLALDRARGRLYIASWIPYPSLGSWQGDQLSVRVLDAGSGAEVDNAIAGLATKGPGFPWGRGAGGQQFVAVDAASGRVYVALAGFGSLMALSGGP